MSDLYSKMKQRSHRWRFAGVHSGGAREEHPVEHAFADDKYAINKHIEFKNMMEDYIPRSQCSVIKPQASCETLPATEPSNVAVCKSLNEYDIRDHRDYGAQSKVSDITQHPQYPSLMKRYARQDKSTCPPTYKPCPPVSTDAVSQKYQELVADIRKHPQYKATMSKYALQDTTTCPPTYKPCPPVVMNQNQKQKLLAAVKSKVDSEYVHKDLIKDEYVHKSELKDQYKKYLSASMEEGSVLSPADVTKHPQCKALLEKYALKDTSTCPPTYKQCKPLNQYPISDHPDIDKYILKSQIPSKIPRDVGTEKKLEQANLKIAEQQKIINQLKSRSVSEFEGYQELLDTYAYKDNSTCPPKYKPCSQRPLSSYPIENHPDIKDYIRKSRLPDLIDRECKQHFIQGSNRTGPATVPRIPAAPQEEQRRRQEEVNLYGNNFGEKPFEESIEPFMGYRQW